MAKRKRLAPAKLDTDTPPLETKSAGRLSAHPAPPIAHVAGDASAAAALEELSETLRRARAEGRMILDVPLKQIDERYLVRDRVVAGREDMEALQASIKARGQQTPIELVELDGRYGLISGWRRLQALRMLGQETAKAIVTAPREASESYVAMIEENEIRVGLSYFERARIVVKSVEAGVFDSYKTALQSLFMSASRAKRSKIKSFIPVVDQLGDVLRFPADMGERLGLQLSKALQDDPQLAQRCVSALHQSYCRSPEHEQEVLNKTLKGGLDSVSASGSAPAKKRNARSVTPVVGITVSAEGQSLILRGKGVTPQLRSDLLIWLKGRS